MKAYEIVDTPQMIDTDLMALALNLTKKIERYIDKDTNLEFFTAKYESKLTDTIPEAFGPNIIKYVRVKGETNWMKIN